MSDNMSQADLFEEPGIRRHAEMSLDLKYRWLLTRTWGAGAWVLWVMLNPSDADGTRDDPTLSRCIAFSRRWGYGGLVVVNLAALVSSKPEALCDDRVDPVGGLNDHFILEAMDLAVGGLAMAAWGSTFDFSESGGAPFFLRNRDRRVLSVLTRRGDVYCLGKTKSGAPIHPMARGRSRVPDNAQPVLFAPMTVAT